MFILSPARVKALHVRMLECKTLDELYDIGDEIRQNYASDRDRILRNAELLEPLRKSYEKCLARM